MRALARPLATPLKVALLTLVFLRFHGSWIGVAVVLGMGLLLFGVDRSARRGFRRALRGSGK